MANLSVSHNRLALTVREKAARAIKGVPERLYSPGNSGGLQLGAGDGVSNDEQQYRAAMRGWQFSAIKVIATSCANQEIRVGVQRGRKRSEKELKAYSHRFQDSPVWVKALSEQIDILNVHPIIDLVENPNRFPAGTQYSLKWCTVFSLNATGKAYWYVRKNPAKESAGHDLYYLPSTWVFPAVNNENEQIGWVVKSPSQEQGLPVPYEDIVPFVIPDPSHPAYSLSYLQTQAPAVNTDDKIQTANYRAMENGIYPGLALHVASVKNPVNGTETVPELTPDQRKQLIDTVMGAAAGATKFGMPFIVDGMIEKISTVTNKPAEMAFRDGAKDQQERIFLAYGVNPIVAGQIENANRASSFVAHEGFYRTVVNPLLTLMGQTLTKYLAPRFANGKKGLYVWFEEALARDEDLHLRQLQMGLIHGLLEGNEYREAIGLHPHPELNKLVQARQAASAGVGRPPST